MSSAPPRRLNPSNASANEVDRSKKREEMSGPQRKVAQGIRPQGAELANTVDLVAPSILPTPTPRKGTQ